MLPFLVVGGCIFVLLVPFMILIPPTGMALHKLTIYVAMVIAIWICVANLIHK